MPCPNAEGCHDLNRAFAHASNRVESLRQDTTKWLETEGLPDEMRADVQAMHNMHSVESEPLRSAEEFVLSQNPAELCFACPIRALRQAIIERRQD